MNADKEKPKYVVCIWNRPNPASLDMRKLYRVVPDRSADETGMTRIVDESGEDHMYPAAWFVPLDLPEQVTRVLAEPQKPAMDDEMSAPDRPGPESGGAVPLDYAGPNLDISPLEKLSRFLTTLSPRQWAFSFGLAAALGGFGVALGREEAALVMSAGGLLVGLSVPLRRP